MVARFELVGACTLNSLRHLYWMNVCIFGTHFSLVPLETSFSLGLQVLRRLSCVPILLQVCLHFLAEGKFFTYEPMMVVSLLERSQKTATSALVIVHQEASFVQTMSCLIEFRVVI